MAENKLSDADIFARSLQNFASNVVKEKSKAIIEKAKIDLERVLMEEADRMALNVLKQYDITSNAQELIIKVRKD